MRPMRRRMRSRPRMRARTQACGSSACPGRMPDVNETPQRCSSSGSGQDWARSPTNASAHENSQGSAPRPRPPRPDPRRRLRLELRRHELRRRFRRLPARPRGAALRRTGGARRRDAEGRANWPRSSSTKRAGSTASRSRSSPIDDAADPETGVEAAEAAIDEGLDGVVGPYNSGVGVETLPLYIEGRPGPGQADLGHLDQRPRLHPAADDLPDRPGRLAGADRVARRQEGRDRLRPDPELHASRSPRR